MIYGTHPKFADGADDAYRTFRDLDLCVEQARRELTPHVNSFTSIVVTGISGLAVGSPVALALGKPLVVIRKASPDDICGEGEVLGSQDLGSAPLFLDDLISTGTTYRRVEKKIGQPLSGGTYTYESGHFAPWQED